MVVALVVAVLAVVLGLALGLAPGARRHALGPLRTMALTAVIAVIAVHLLPEALSELGWLGVGLFALALGLPRWIDLLRRAPATDGGKHVGLELGFWGLVVHHVGDGLALGAYASVDARGGDAHSDVLLALVLHTVPLVAVISAGYARLWGARSAVLRSSVLALASCIGVLAAGLLPAAELVTRGQAWIAAGVAGLLLHGIAHDLTEDLPATEPSRALDLLAALFGGGFGWLSAALDHHAEGEFSAVLLASFVRGVERTALPLLIGLVLAAALASRASPRPASQLERLRSSAFSAGLGLESLLLGAVQLGVALTLAAHAFVLLVLALAADPKSVPELPARGFLPNLARRLDWLGVWALAGFLLALVLDAGVPRGELESISEYVLLAVVAWVGVGLPVPAVATLLVGQSLAGKGFGGAATLLLVAWPPSARSVERARRWLVLPALAVASLLLGPMLTPRDSGLDPQLSWIAAAILLGLVLWRVYRVGLRGWIAPLATGHERSV